MTTIINASTVSGLVNSADTSGILQLQTASTAALTIDANQRTAFVAGTAALPAITTTGDTNTGIFFPAADMIAFSEGGAESMRIDSSGNVGIGTSSPSSKLDVSGVVSLQGTTLPSAGTARLYSRSSDSSFYMQAASGGSINLLDGSQNSMGLFGPSLVQFFTGNTEKMRIDNSGHVMIGSTSVPAFGAGPPLFVKADGNGISVGYGTANTEYRIFYFNAGDAAMYVHNGNNYASLSAAGAWTNASDVRLKKNIVDIKYGLADVLKAQPRSYQMHDVAGDFVGFVAQELQEVIPEVVSGDPEKQLGVDYGSLVAVAFKAIQELKAINDTQAETINALTARIVALEQK